MENAAHVVAPCRDHTQAIILLHGRDSIASEFAEEFFESQASDDRTLPEIFPTTRWVFPTSKIRNSARFEAPMSQWFDMWSLENRSEKNEIQINELRESVKEILDLIRAEAVLISPDRIILGGISQGCATAIHTLLYGGIRLGGFIGLSSWLPFEPEITATMADNMAWSIVGNRLHYSHKMLNTPTDQAKRHQSFQTLAPLLCSRPQSSCHTPETTMLFLLPVERSYSRHWKNSAWWFRGNSTKMKYTGSVNLKEWMTLYHSFASSSLARRRSEKNITASTPGPEQVVLIRISVTSGCQNL
jgi:predicted esterase